MMGLTEARVIFGTATFKERMGFRYPWLFRRWAADNARRDLASARRSRRASARSALASDTQRGGN